MLGKLLKHEFRATARIFLPVYLAAICLGVVANVSIRILDSVDNDVLTILAGLYLVAFFIVLAAIAIFAIFLMANRFYKNLMTDEGYLMFTLPVNVHQLIWSKLIVSVTWFIITAIVEFISIMIMVFRVGFVKYFFEGTKEFLAALAELAPAYTAHGTAFILEIIVLSLLSMIGICLFFYAALAIGHSFNNHKMLMSVAAYFVLNFAISSISSILMFTVINLPLFWDMPDVNSMLMGIHFYLGICFLFSLAESAVLYILTAFMLKRRLNLE